MTGHPPDPGNTAEGLMAYGAWALSTNPETLAALRAGIPVPRSLLKKGALYVLHEPELGPDFRLTPEIALRLSMAGQANGDAQEAARAGLTIQTLEDFAAVDEPSAEPILGGEEDCLLSLGGMMVLYGDGGAGKTTLELDLVMHLASGTDWLGIQTQTQSRVLVIENEGPRGMFRKKARRKLESWEGSAVDSRVQVLEDPWAVFSFSEEAYREHLAHVISELEIDIVAAGPVNRLGIEGGGTPEEVGAFILNIELIRQKLARPVAVIFAHHENKAGDVSGAWEGVPDTLCHVQAQGNGRTRCHWQKVRWGPALHGRTWNLLWRDGESFEVEEKVERTDEDIEGELLVYIANHPGTTWKPVRETLGVQIERITQIRDKMLADGRLVNTGSKTRLALYLSGTVDTQEDIPL